MLRYEQVFEPQTDDFPGHFKGPDKLVYKNSWALMKVSKGARMVAMRAWRDDFRAVVVTGGWSWDGLLPGIIWPEPHWWMEAQLLIEKVKRMCEEDEFDAVNVAYVLSRRNSQDFGRGYIE